MAKKYVVDLNEGEKADLVALIQKGRSGARKIKGANILLLRRVQRFVRPIHGCRFANVPLTASK